MKPFNTKERFSIPNLMGYFRLLLIPVFCYLYLAKEAYHCLLYTSCVPALPAAGPLGISKLEKKGLAVQRRAQISRIISAHVPKPLDRAFINENLSLGGRFP